MNRLLGSFIATVLVGLIVGCQPRKADVPAEAAATPLDSEAALTPGMADVAELCRRTRFVDARASGPLAIPGATGVVVRVFPAERSHRYKLENLGRGRILARLDNQENGDYANLALYGAKGQSCWYVWEDRDTGELRSKYVSWNGTGETPDRNFHIDIHPLSHESEESKWKEDRELGLEAGSGVFALASTASPVPQGDPIFRTGPWMWTTCLSNGCCRSRQ